MKMQFITSTKIKNSIKDSISEVTTHEDDRSVYIIKNIIIITYFSQSTTESSSNAKS